MIEFWAESPKEIICLLLLFNISQNWNFQSYLTDMPDKRVEHDMKLKIFDHNLGTRTKIGAINFPLGLFLDWAAKRCARMGVWVGVVSSLVK